MKTGISLDILLTLFKKEKDHPRPVERLRRSLRAEGWNVRYYVDLSEKEPELMFKFMYRGVLFTTMVLKGFDPNDIHDMELLQIAIQQKIKEIRDTEKEHPHWFN